MPGRLKIVFCKLVNSFEDYQSHFFSTSDGKGNVIRTLSYMAVQISESKPKEHQ